MPYCDKCGTAVPIQNDVSYLRFILTGNPNHLLMLSRHLLPVVQNDVTMCEGSPSLAQYLKGQPRDTRGYPFNVSQIERIRAAYAILLSL